LPISKACPWPGEARGEASEQAHTLTFRRSHVVVQAVREVLMAAVLRQTQLRRAAPSQLDKGPASTVLGAMQYFRYFLDIGARAPHSPHSEHEWQACHLLPFAGEIVGFNRRCSAQGTIPDAYAGIRPIIAPAVLNVMRHPKVVPQQHLDERIRGSGFGIKSDGSNLRQRPAAVQENACNITIGTNTQSRNHLDLGMAEAVHNGDNRRICHALQESGKRQLRRTIGQLRGRADFFDVVRQRKSVCIGKDAESVCWDCIHKPVSRSPNQASRPRRRTAAAIPAQTDLVVGLSNISTEPLPGERGLDAYVGYTQPVRFVGLLMPYYIYRNTFV
jgi:hypothetical protein